MTPIVYSPSFNFGYTITINGLKSESNHILGPWMNESILFKGINNGGSSITYKYQFVCPFYVLITDIWIYGNGFNSDSMLYVTNLHETMTFEALNINMSLNNSIEKVIFNNLNILSNGLILYEFDTVSIVLENILPLITQSYLRQHQLWFQL